MSADALLVVLGLAAGAATLVGGLLAMRLRARAPLLLGLSAGAVLGLALFDLLPEAMALGRARTGMAAGLVGLGFLAYLTLHRGLPRAEGGHHGDIGAASLTAHSVMDGLAIGLGFQASAAVGAAAAAAVLAHDLADGANTVSVSQIGGPRPAATRLWLGLDALAPLVGIGVSRLVAPGPALLSALLALFCGAFLYIGAGELLPRSLAARPGALGAASTVLGAAAIWGVVHLAAG